MQDDPVVLSCWHGSSAQRRVLLGFAPAELLRAISFADVLDEDTHRGYQRRFNNHHSLDFRRYIQKPDSSTIPLTFNLRPTNDGSWRIIELNDRQVRLEILKSTPPVLAQVDCQHRLGHLSEVKLELPFMCFIGLSEREEMEVFNTINSKAKGLSTSLLDFHDAQLARDLAGDRPELFIALLLNNDARSPWHRQLDLGGKATTGMLRRASLRTMQKAVKRFISQSKILNAQPIEEASRVALEFWAGVALAMPHEWADPRKHFLNKGIGVYALMDVAADIYRESGGIAVCDRHYFAAALSDFCAEFDWSTCGPLKGLGGESGVKTAVERIREVRRKARFKVISNG